MNSTADKRSNSLKSTARLSEAQVLSTDNDPLFLFHRWKANLRVLDVNEIKTVPFVPLSHPFVERLIGTLRREYFGQVFFWNANDLERKLSEFNTYFNQERMHTALHGNTPIGLSM